MRQVCCNAGLTTLQLPKLKTVTGNLEVRARPRPRWADCTLMRSRAHRAEPLLPPSWRVITRASGVGERKAEDLDLPEAIQNTVTHSDSTGFDYGLSNIRRGAPISPPRTSTRS